MRTEPLLRSEKPALEAAGSVVEVPAPEPEIPEGSEPESAVEITKEAGEPLAASTLGWVPGTLYCGKRYSRFRERCPWELAARQGLQPERVAGSRPEPRRCRASGHIRIDKRRRGAHPVNVAALEKAKSGV